MASNAGPLTYLLYDLATGAYRGRIPLNSVTFGSQLGQPGQLSGTIDLASTGVQNLGPVSATQPARTALACATAVLLPALVVTIVLVVLVTRSGGF